MKTLDRLVSEILIQRYVDCKFVKMKAARTLDISSRGLRLKLHIIKDKYPDLYGSLIPLLPVHDSDDYHCQCFPTNKERLKYADTKSFRY